MHFINSAFKLLNLRSKMLETFGQVRTYHREYFKITILKENICKIKRLQEKSRTQSDSRGATFSKNV